MQQQQQEKTLTCKKCHNKIPMTLLVPHFTICEGKIKCNPPEENPIKIEQNIQDFVKQSQNIKVEDAQEKKESQEENIRVEKQNNSELKQQENGQQIKCNFCQKLLYSHEIESHEDECEDLLRFQTQQIADSEELFPNNLQDTQPESFPSTRTQEFESLLGDGTIRQTRIKRDILTNFTHYHTSFKNDQNISDNIFLRNLGNQIPDSQPQQIYEDQDNSEGKAKEENDENSEPYVLAKFEFKQSPELSEENKKCSICLSEFQVGDNLTALPCFHRFHDQCAIEWFREKQQVICPNCKFEINDQAYQDF